jgi:hypothetical protein
LASDQYRRELAQLAKDIGKVRTDIGKEEEKARTARAAAAQKRGCAQRSSSQSTRESYLRQADSEDKKVAAAERAIGTLQDKLSTLMTRQGGKEQSLRIAEKSEQATRDRAADAKLRKEVAEHAARIKAEETRRKKEKALQDALDRDAARRRRTETEHARELGRLSSGTVHHVHVREPEPEKLRVLYLTASPATPNLDPLRVDAEVNNVLTALRGAQHRDLVDFRHRPAATVQDLVDGLNDLRPHVVHFSGHAGEGLLFDTADPTTPGDQLVGYQHVASLLMATDQPPTLVVLNACHTANGVEDMLQVAPVVIATNDRIGDSSAHIFAVQFYGAIAAAQTIGDAVRQARAVMEMALPDEKDALVVSAAEGVDPDEVKLVRPHPTS